MLNRLKAVTATSAATLLLSSGTLVCCALPALFVALGAGASLAALVSTFPFLVTLSQHKAVLFAAAGIGLALGGVLQWRQRSWPCPADARLAAACRRSRRFSAWLYAIAVLVYLVGGFFAFGLTWLQRL